MTTTISEAQTLIQLTILAIVNNQPEELNKYLVIMPLDKVDAIQANELLSTLLEYAGKYNRVSLVPIILNKWQFVYPGSRLDTDNILQKPTDEKIYIQKGTQLNLLTELFINNIFSIDIVAFVAKAFPDFGFMDVIENLINYDASQLAFYGCRRALDIYGSQTNDVLNILLESNGNRNYQLTKFLQNEIRFTAPYAPIPKWVKNFINGPVPKESQLKIPPDVKITYVIPSSDKIAQLLNDGLSELGLTKEEIMNNQQKLDMDIQLLSTNDKIKIMDPVIQYQIGDEQQDDTELFRILGPANPRRHPTPEQMKYGGSRMFTDDTYDYDDNLGITIDWFQGHCLECNLRIRRKWHAIRIPDERGGFFGSYCSFKCARQYLLNGEEFDFIKILMVSVMETQININGIQDRLPNNISNLTSIQLETVDDRDKPKIPPIVPLFPFTIPSFPVLSPIVPSTSFISPSISSPIVPSTSFISPSISSPSLPLSPGEIYT